MELNSSGNKNYLDVCYLQTAISPHRKETTVFYMTLLAYAVVQKQQKMVAILLESGASKYTYVARLTTVILLS